MHKIPIFIVLYALSGSAIAGGYSELTVTQMFIDCVRARTHEAKVRCETEYLQYRAELEDYQRNKRKIRK